MSPIAVASASTFASCMREMRDGRALRNFCGRAGSIRLGESWPAAKANIRLVVLGGAFAPQEYRALLFRKGVSRIAAFHTRIPMHRSHAYLIKIAIEVPDGALIYDGPLDIQRSCEQSCDGALEPDRVKLDSTFCRGKWAGMATSQACSDDPRPLIAISGPRPRDAQISASHIPPTVPGTEQSAADLARTIADLNALDRTPNAIIPTGEFTRRGSREHHELAAALRRHWQRVTAVFSPIARPGGRIGEISPMVMPCTASGLRKTHYSARMHARLVYHLHRFDAAHGFATEARIFAAARTTLPPEEHRDENRGFSAALAPTRGDVRAQ